MTLQGRILCFIPELILALLLLQWKGGKASDSESSGKAIPWVQQLNNPKNFHKDYYDYVHDLANEQSRHVWQDRKLQNDIKKQIDLLKNTRIDGQDAFKKRVQTIEGLTPVAQPHSPPTKKVNRYRGILAPVYKPKTPTPNAVKSPIPQKLHSSTKLPNVVVGDDSTSLGSMTEIRVTPARKIRQKPSRRKKPPSRISSRRNGGRKPSYGKRHRYHQPQRPRPRQRVRHHGSGMALTSALSGFLALAGLIGVALAGGLFNDDDDDTTVTFNPNITIGGDNITVSLNNTNTLSNTLTDTNTLTTTNTQTTTNSNNQVSAVLPILINSDGTLTILGPIIGRSLNEEDSPLSHFAKHLFKQTAEYFMGDLIPFKDYG